MEPLVRLLPPLSLLAMAGFFSTVHAQEGRYCGNMYYVPKEVVSVGSEVTVEFQSRSGTTGRGFLLNYATEKHADLITCLSLGSHFSDEALEYRKYCPAGCFSTDSEIMGCPETGYRDSSPLCRAAVHAGVLAADQGGSVMVRRAPGAHYYKGSRANGIASTDGPLSDWLFKFKTDGCDAALGFASGAVADAQLTASSTLQWYDAQGALQAWPAHHARLGLHGPPWAPFNLDDRQWLQVDLQTPKRVVGIVTTGSAYQNYNFFVTAYKLSYSLEGAKWTFYKTAALGEDKVFEGNTNQWQEARHSLLPALASARFVRLHPTAWHGKIALKAELLGCEPLSPRGPLLPAVRTRLSNTRTRDSTAMMETLSSHEGGAATRNGNGTLRVEERQGWNAWWVALPVALALTTLVSVLVIYTCVKNRRSRRKAAEGAASTQLGRRAGCCLSLKRIFPSRIPEPADSLINIRYHPDKRQSHDIGAVLSNIEGARHPDYAVPLMTPGQVGKGSTFKPDESAWRDDPHRAAVAQPQPPLPAVAAATTPSQHTYTEPIPSGRPEYAMPIVLQRAAASPAVLAPPAITGSVASSLGASYDRPGQRKAAPGGLGVKKPQLQQLRPGGVPAVAVEVGLGYKAPIPVDLSKPEEDSGYRTPRAALALAPALPAPAGMTTAAAPPPPCDYDAPRADRQFDV
ncbi:discoidin, CUB and LCCL domain-containing protein 2-like isoform X2 [Lethenteron reissneri]|uniref:discoidin, CUB and LCCL domain-containing protein 2-like isoform X2 n=1 Tax=Lethenteron reissneri TaxID=7753 RepID=UPI002AB7D28E|nr:discoidin, CUB and LCCL domain-containing protein 2-like isoform X2 [Lethenteron reissneri]